MMKSYAVGEYTAAVGQTRPNVLQTGQGPWLNRARRYCMHSTELLQKRRNRDNLSNGISYPENGWHARNRGLVRASPGDQATRNNAAAVADENDKTKFPTDEDHMRILKEELSDERIVTIAQVAPAVRVALGEEFGMEPGATVAGKLVTALRKLGFDYVFDVIAGADLTIMEEGTELVHRLRDHLEGQQDAAKLPMFTSCCPGWIEFVEKCAPEMIPHISTAKSPHMIQGAVLKAFFSEVIGRPEGDIRVASIMPCVRKQGEADRLPYVTKEGHRQVDHVITTRNIAQMIKDAGIDFEALPDSHFDHFMGYGSGASVIFGTTGGTMEAALRTVYDIVTEGSGDAMERLEYDDVRGMDGIKETTVVIPSNPNGPLHNTDPIEIKVAVANGLGNAKKLLKEAEEGTSKYHFVEVMACPGGCIGGGGQPKAKGKEVLLARQHGLYALDKGEKIRKSYQNPLIQDLYAKYLGQPGSTVAEELLHTEYTECGPGKFNLFEEVQEKSPEECEDEEICFAEDSE